MGMITTRRPIHSAPPSSCYPLPVSYAEIQKMSLFSLQSKSSETYEGENSSLVFRLTHPGSEALVFSAETDSARDRWTEVLKDAVRLDVDAT